MNLGFRNLKEILSFKITNLNNFLEDWGEIQRQCNHKNKTGNKKKENNNNKNIEKWWMQMFKPLNLHPETTLDS
jgi:hypothetical protein